MPDDDRPKKSWREIDSKRDRSQHRGPSEKRHDSPFGGGKKGEQRQKTYRSQLDRLFESGGIGKLVADQEKQKQEELAQKMGMRPAPAAAPADKPAAPAAPPVDEGRIKKLAAVRDAIGPDAITKAVSAYLKTYPWPNDLDFLSAALEHRDEDMIREALTRLASALAAGKPRRAATLAGRLRTLEELGADAEIRQKASELRRKL